MIAVPVSWHIGSTPPAAMLAFLRKSKATNLSLSEASGSSTMCLRLCEMRRPQQMIDVGEGGFRERAQRLARHHQDLLAHDFLDADAVSGDLAVGRRVLAERKQRRVLVWRGRMCGKVRGAFMLARSDSDEAIQNISQTAPDCFAISRNDAENLILATNPAPSPRVRREGRDEGANARLRIATTPVTQ
jgi:hypothetical protein